MVSIVVEKDAFEGVKRIAEKFAKDFELVYGSVPKITDKESVDDDLQFVFTTINSSLIADKLEETCQIKIKGKRECYQIIKDENKVYVVGSDKRGTIYGIFDISEQIGVTPFIYWGDAIPSKRSSYSTDDFEEKISKEPSVEYRGFFINDEWPCYGNWTFDHFDGFTAEMYDHVFEFLLRMKGNCLWPAMWSSSFALDGPGQLNEELADIYGVVIDYSHHEPCLRASEEWDIYKGQEYGTEWNYSTNKEGLHKYWRDGIIRSSKYENIITMGMRGERDSKMQGVNTLADCIEAWKEIINNQDKLINEYAQNPDRHPKLVAIYKEVEDYFFGDETTKGLAGWEGLDDKILMFCEDNFGYMRRLPQGQMQNHPGGLGMYFHLDYHGDPISYEWINSTPLYKIWEQMSVAYHHGVKKMWMVNVGDLKGNEYPLSYFMAMAYDFDKWGDGNLDSFKEYATYFSKQVFATDKVADVLTEGIDIIACRKPEALSVNTYSLFHGEVDYMIARCKRVLAELKEIKLEISSDKLEAYYSMVEYPIEIGINHVLLHLYAKKNEHFAKQGKHFANVYGQLLTQCYEREKEIKKSFSSFKNGKWKGMELAAHTGFTKWNEDGAIKPLRYVVEPLDTSHLLVSRNDDDYVARKNYGSYERIVINDYSYMGENCACLEVANTGISPIKCNVNCESSVFNFSWTEKEVSGQENLLIYINPDEIDKMPELTEAEITDGDTTVIVELRKPKDYVIIDCLDTKETTNQSFIPLVSYGKHKNAIKLLEGSNVTYEFEINNLTKAAVEICLAPTSALDQSNQLNFAIKVNENEKRIDVLDKDYKAGNCVSQQWSMGVLNNERRVTIETELEKGKNTICLKGITSGVIIEKLIIRSIDSTSNYTGM